MRAAVEGRVSGERAVDVGVGAYSGSKGRSFHLLEPWFLHG